MKNQGCFSCLRKQPHGGQSQVKILITLIVCKLLPKTQRLVMKGASGEHLTFRLNKIVFNKYYESLRRKY